MQVPLKASNLLVIDLDKSDSKRFKGKVLKEEKKKETKNEEKEKNKKEKPETKETKDKKKKKVQ